MNTAGSMSSPTVLSSAVYSKTELAGLLRSDFMAAVSAGPAAYHGLAQR